MKKFSCVFWSLLSAALPFAVSYNVIAQTSHSIDGQALQNYPVPGVSTSAPGLAPTLPSDATKYFDGTGNYTKPASPPNVSTGGAGLAPALPGGSSVYLDGSGAYSAPEPMQHQQAVNNWVPFVPDGTEAAGTTGNANQIYCMDGYRDRLDTFGAVGFRVTTLQASSAAQVAIYTDYQGNPGNLVASTADIVTTSAVAVSGPFTSGGSSVTAQIGPGSAVGKRFWYCMNRNNSSTVFAGLAVSSLGHAARVGTANLGDLFSSNAAFSGRACSGASCNGGSSTYGSWPASLIGSTWSNNATSGRTTLVAGQVVSDP